jgi:hypothetical protein
MEAEAEKKCLEAEAEEKCLEAEAEEKHLQAEAEEKRLESEAEKKRLEADEAENQRLEVNLSPMYDAVNNFLEWGQLTPVLDNDGYFDLAVEEAQNALIAPGEEQNNNVDVHEDPKKKRKRNKSQKQIVPHQSRTSMPHMWLYTM